MSRLQQRGGGGGERVKARPRGWPHDAGTPRRHAAAQVNMRVDEQCKVLCRIDSMSAPQAKAFRAKVEDDYRVNM